MLQRKKNIFWTKSLLTIWRATYEAAAKSDVSIDSSESICKPTKRRIQKEDIGSEMKKKRLSSPMHQVVLLFEKQHSRWDHNKWLLHQVTPLLTRTSL
jgi:hypothetical protein